MNGVFPGGDFTPVATYQDLAGNTVAGNGDGDAVALGGTLGYSMTWPAGYELPLLVEGDLTVQSGAELTVEPGVEISFEGRVGLYVHGALRAAGTPAQPITFTASSPPTGYWDGVFFDEDSDDARNLLEYVTLIYPGYATYWHNALGTGIGVYDAAPTIRHVTVRHSNGYGLWARDTSLTLSQDTLAESGGGAYLWNAHLTMADSTITDNRWARSSSESASPVPPRHQSRCCRTRFPR